MMYSGLNGDDRYPQITKLTLKLVSYFLILFAKLRNVSLNNFMKCHNQKRNEETLRYYICNKQLLLIDVVFRRNTTVLVPNNLNLKH